MHAIILNFEFRKSKNIFTIKKLQTKKSCLVLKKIFHFFKRWNFFFEGKLFDDAHQYIGLKILIVKLQELQKPTDEFYFVSIIRLVSISFPLAIREYRYIPAVNSPPLIIKLPSPRDEIS